MPQIDPDTITMAELGLAARNHGLPLEALRYDLTPAGLHYLLTHFDIPDLDVSAWRLDIGGLVGTPLSLSYDELRARPPVTLPVTLECAGNGRARMQPRPISQPWLLEAVGTAEWTGTPLRALLDEVGIDDSAVELVFTGADRGVENDIELDYGRSLTVAQARQQDILVVWAMNGAPLLPQHGYPVRLIVPGWYGMTHVKWLSAITAVATPFDGHHQTGTYLVKADDDDPGRPVSQIAPRALLIPPGIPEFLSRRRLVTPGPHTINGRAWSGRGRVTRVEFSADGGQTWVDTDLGEALGTYAWAPWSAAWEAIPGAYTLSARATDDSGAVQPVAPVWNVQGMENNATQHVPVTVAPR